MNDAFSKMIEEEVVNWAKLPTVLLELRQNLHKDLSML